MEAFDLQKVKDLYLLQSQEYVSRYFVPLATGNHAVYINGNFVIIENAIVKSTYFKRMNKEINKRNFEKYDKLRHIGYKLKMEMFSDNKINLRPQMKHKKYDGFSEEVKSKVKIMLDCILEILASGNESVYDFLKWFVKWFVKMVGKYDKRKQK